MTTMLAVKKTGRESGVLVETVRPEPGHGEVLVKVRACAICASDLPGWQSADQGDETPGEWNKNNLGLTGHELAGDIVATGDKQLEARLGQRVWIDPIAGCGDCPECVTGRQTGCANVTVVSQGFAEYVIAPSRQCHPIPATMDYITASLIPDMVGTPFAAARRAAIQPHESVGVWGLGPVGLGLVQAARIAGSTRIVGCDILASRRRIAERLGASLTVDPTKPEAMDLVRQFGGAKPGRGSVLSSRSGCDSPGI
jgi:threonine dehydrogenase-like Zn-dependent dehydrogenase